MKHYGAGLAAAASAAGYLVLTTTTRTDSTLMLALWTGLFLLYGLLLYVQTDRSFSLLIGAAVGFRVVSMLPMPLLSDDVYRFIWDGQLLTHGYNPFLFLPSELIGSPVATASGLTAELFRKLNSPDYYTVYPPLLQSLFGLATGLSASQAETVFWLRLPLLLGELVSIRLLYLLVQQLTSREATARQSTLLYALNPLVIVELAGNIHYEGLVICFLLACLYFFRKEKIGLSAVFLGLAIGVKLLPLIFLPALLNRTKRRDALLYLLVVGGAVVVPFLFFFDQQIIGRFLTSIDLYFRKFEFNASLYYVLRWAGTRLVGYNPISILGPLLSLVSLSAILYLSFSRWLAFTFFERLLLILSAYLFCATTVHPWYVVPLVALSATGRFRFPVVWSVLLPLTYLAYGQIPFQENLWVVALEYLLVGGWLYWEVKEYASGKVA